jgi:ABC-type polysaccharide/polyol phosphate transport system ATPase subunit
VFENFKREGRTIVFVSHAMEPISRFCDRVIYLRRGEELVQGKPDEIIKLYMDSLHDN